MPSGAYLKRAFCALVTSAIILAPLNALASSSVSLKTTTTADQTASIGLPTGWTLAKGGNGFVYVTGPNDERINLGALVVAKNAPLGTSVGGEVAFAMPFR